MMNKYNTIIPNGAIYIEGSRIIDIGDTIKIEKSYSADEIIDASNNVVMSGLINKSTYESIKIVYQY